MRTELPCPGGEKAPLLFPIIASSQRASVLAASQAMRGQPSKMRRGHGAKPPLRGRSGLRVCPDPQECCLLTDVLAAKLRVTDEAARKGRQRDPGLPDKVVHIEWADRGHGSEVQVLASPREGEALP